MRSAFLLLILCTTACSILRPDENPWNPPFIIDKRCEIHPNGKKDTIRGSIQCDVDKYTYEYHENSYQGPLTGAEKFRYAFIGNYHNKFFDHIYIDTKLSAKYMDSVEILVIVQKNQFRGTYLFECKACNQVATLRFRKKVYNFPFFSTIYCLSHCSSNTCCISNQFRSKKKIVLIKETRNIFFRYAPIGGRITILRINCAH